MLRLHMLSLLILSAVPLYATTQPTPNEDPFRKDRPVAEELKAPSQTCIDCAQATKKGRAATISACRCCGKEAFAMLKYIGITVIESCCCLCSDCSETPPHDS